MPPAGTSAAQRVSTVKIDVPKFSGQPISAYADWMYVIESLLATEGFSADEIKDLKAGTVAASIDANRKDRLWSVGGVVRASLTGAARTHASDVPAGDLAMLLKQLASVYESQNGPFRLQALKELLFAQYDGKISIEDFTRRKELLFTQRLQGKLTPEELQLASLAYCLPKEYTQTINNVTSRPNPTFADLKKEVLNFSQLSQYQRKENTSAAMLTGIGGPGTRKRKRGGRKKNGQKNSNPSPTSDDEAGDDTEDDAPTTKKKKTSPNNATSATAMFNQLQKKFEKFQKGFNKFKGGKNGGKGGNQWWKDGGKGDNNWNHDWQHNNQGQHGGKGRQP